MCVAICQATTEGLSETSSSTDLCFCSTAQIVLERPSRVRFLNHRRRVRFGGSRSPWCASSWVRPLRVIPASDWTSFCWRNNIQRNLAVIQQKKRSVESELWRGCPCLSFPDCSSAPPPPPMHMARHALPCSSTCPALRSHTLSACGMYQLSEANLLWVFFHQAPSMP